MESVSVSESRLRETSGSTWGGVEGVGVVTVAVDMSEEDGFRAGDGEIFETGEQPVRVYVSKVAVVVVVAEEEGSVRQRELRRKAKTDSG